MKIITCEQYSPEWVKARLGIPTASEFHRIITAVKGDLSKQAPKYAYALVAETLLGRPLERQEVNTWAMQRGKDLEPAAAEQYEFMTDTEARQVGFITSDDGRLGCSPDRLVLIGGVVKPRGGLEIKCTLDEGHMGIWVDGPGDDYRQQYEGSLYVADELEFWDLHAYHPDLPSATLRKLRDAVYQAKMRVALGQFLEMRDAMLAKAIASGFFAERAAVIAGQIPAPADAGPGVAALFGLDAIQAGVIVSAGRPARRKPKLEPVIACKLAKAAARKAAASPPAAPEPAPPAPAAPTPAMTPVKALGARAAALAAAQAGQLPGAPDFSANTHKPYRAKLAALIALVAAGDVAGLEAFEIKATNSSPKAMAKYRDQAVIALRARGTRAG